MGHCLPIGKEVLDKVPPVIKTSSPRKEVEHNHILVVEQDDDRGKSTILVSLLGEDGRIASQGGLLTCADVVGDLLGRANSSGGKRKLCPVDVVKRVSGRTKV